MSKQIFIHSLWRTGSTYIWNKFRQNSSYYCYYEPLYERLIEAKKEELQQLSTNEKLKDLNHPIAEQYNTYEFPIEPDGGVNFFTKGISYDRYCLDTDAEDSELLNYLDYLIDVTPENKKPLLQFCRTSLRIGWCKSTFPEAYHTYIKRSARNQWESCLSIGEREYFIVVLFLIIGKSTNNLVSPIKNLLDIPQFTDASTHQEFLFYKDVTTKYSLEDKYRIFYFLWLISLNEANKADSIIDIDELSTNNEYRASIEDFFDLDLSDCLVKTYNKYTLNTTTMDEIEFEIHELVSNTKGI